MRHFKPFHIPEDLQQSAAAIDIIGETIETIDAAFASKVITASTLTAACLLQINRMEPYLNAFIWLNSAALEDAAKVDAELSAGRRRGPLHGVPVVLKDNMNLVGTRTTAGYAGFASEDRVVDPQQGAFNGLDLFPTSDAALILRLKDAGAIIVGKSNLPDFGLDGLRAQSSHNGDTLNAYDARFAPGASSTGSATAVAVGMGIVSIGTDTAGSILFPASAQSLVGLKPSFGVVPTNGVYPGLFNHDVAGPITRNVYDAAVVLDVIANENGKSQTYAEALRTGALKGKRIGLFEPGIWAAELHPDVKNHYESMVELIGELGAELVPTVFADTEWQERWQSRKTFPHCNAYLDGVDSYLAALGGNNPVSREAFEDAAGFPIGLATTAPLHGLLSNPAINAKMDGPELEAVVGQARALAEYYEEILAAKRIDALFLPRSIAPLPDISGNTVQYLGDQVCGTEVNELGLPAITIPAGYLKDGRPIAVDFVGSKRLSDADILGLAFDFEQSTKLRRPPSISP